MMKTNKGNFTEVFHGVNCAGDGTEIYSEEEHTEDYKTNNQ